MNAPLPQAGGSAETRPSPDSTASLEALTFSIDSVVAQRCRELVDSIEIPTPFTVEGLVQSVAEKQGLNIRVREQKRHDPEVSGVITRDKTGLITLSWPRHYETSHPWWTVLCVGHELGHVMCGHLDTNRPRPPAGTVTLRRCSVGLASDGNADEAAAEFFGTLLAERIESVPTHPRRRRRFMGRGAQPEAAANFARLLRG